MAVISARAVPQTWRRASVAGATRALSRKARTKVTGNNASGTTHSSGAAAMSVEMWAVTATRRPDGTKARPTQPARSRHRAGAVAAVAPSSGAVARGGQ